MKHSKYMILILLSVLFIAPGISAYIIYTHPYWLGKTTNKGTLINPPILFPMEKYTSLLNDVKVKSNSAKIQFGNKDHWQLMVWSPNDCQKTCLKQVEKISRVHLALGRHFYEVKTTLLLGPEVKLMASNDIQHLTEFNINIRQLNSLLANNVLLKNKPLILLTNPKNYIVLTYNFSAPPNDIFHDLQQLLK